MTTTETYWTLQTAHTYGGGFLIAYEIEHQ